jgi:anti-anti-sigma factor
MASQKERQAMITTERTLAVGPLRLSLIDEDDGHAHVSCSGEVVLPDYRSEDEPLARLLGSAIYARRVLLNLERVTFLDTSGISWLLSLNGQFKKEGGTLVLHSIPPLARVVIQLLHLDRVLPMAPDAAAGRHLLRGPQP